MDDRHRVAGNGGTGQNPAYSPTRPHTRTDPGALGHATGVRHVAPVKSGPTTLGGRGSGGGRRTLTPPARREGSAARPGPVAAANGRAVGRRPWYAPTTPGGPVTPLHWSPRG